MQRTTLEQILEAISGDKLLSNALRAHLLPNPSHNTGVGGQHVGTDHQPGMEAQQTNPELATQMY